MAEPKARTVEVELVFCLRDAKTKKTIGEAKLVEVPMDADRQAGAAMKLNSPAALMAATEIERAQDFTFRELVQAVGATVSRSVAQTLKDWLHP